MASKQNFYSVITEAIRDIQENGFDSLERIQKWIQRIRQSARATLIPESVLDGVLRQTLGKIYTRVVEKGGYARVNPGVSRFDVKKLEPKLRAELERRQRTSAQLIKLNREEMIEKTTRRFSGWATSVPDGGSRAVDKTETKENISKALKSLPFEERRVMIDQGHKFNSSLNNIIAVNNNAIAMAWDSRWREPGYDYREDHKERDGKIYVIRGCWAIEQGLIKAIWGYTDQITAPAEEPFCRCSGVYRYHLRDLPDEMLTEKGRKMLEAVRMR